LQVRFEIQNHVEDERAGQWKVIKRWLTKAWPKVEQSWPKLNKLDQSWTKLTKRPTKTDRRLLTTPSQRVSCPPLTWERTRGIVRLTVASMFWFCMRRRDFF
jgi:hypothetical protein